MARQKEPLKELSSAMSRGHTITRDSFLKNKLKGEKKK